MIYLYIIGNCGNQLFQYAFAKKMALETNDKITICWKSKEDMLKRNQLNNYSLDIHDNITYHKKHFLRTIFYKARSLSSPDGSYRKFERKWARLFSFFGIYNMTIGYFDYKIRNTKDKYITGYFESSKYFNQIKDVIREQYTPIYSKNEVNTNLYTLINSTESVCITIRRGDFLSSEYRDQFMVCTEDYFYKAIEIIKSKVSNPAWFIFSDDIEWVKNNMKFPSPTYYESGNDEIWEKLRLMSSCKHFIISNSTFSWWAQYLSKNDKKVVVAPSVWRWNDPYSNDIYENSWELVDVEQPTA